MSNVIPFSELSRQHKLNLLDHKRREFQEREIYLNRLRKLLFQVEGQMRQAEIEQMELYHAVLDDFQLEVVFPNWGDRVGLQRLFKEHPALSDYHRIPGRTAGPGRMLRTPDETQRNQPSDLKTAKRADRMGEASGQRIWGKIYYKL